MILLHRCCLCGDLATETVAGEHFCDKHYRDLSVEHFSDNAA